MPSRRERRPLRGTIDWNERVILATAAVDRHGSRYFRGAFFIFALGGFLFSVYATQGTVTHHYTVISSHSVVRRIHEELSVNTSTVANTTNVTDATVNIISHSVANRTISINTTNVDQVRSSQPEASIDSSLIVSGSYSPIDLEKEVPKLDEIFKRTVIVTAVSSNHAKELRGMVAGVQKYMPHMPIIVYDMGLRKEERRLILRMCNVLEVRRLDFKKYPPHVKDLLNYAWKPPIIKETLYQFGAIFWADSSIRFKKSIRPLYQFIKKFHGYIPIVTNYNTTGNKFSNYNKTHPAMYKYLGVDLENTYLNDHGYTPAVQGGRVLFVNSSYINEKLLQPWVDCAMALECIAPNGSQNPHAKPIPGYHVHRYDQSALGVLMYKNLRGLFHEGNDASKMFNYVSRVQNFRTKSVSAVRFCKVKK